MFKICEVKVSLEGKNDNLIIKDTLCKELMIKKEKLTFFKILKRSLDARKKDDIHYKFNLAFDVEKDVQGKIVKNNKVSEYKEEKTLIKKVEKQKVVLVVGSGPSGLFSALTLVESGVKVLLIERGECVENRVKAVDKLLAGKGFSETSNIQFGEGGAGTFSDGKLNTGINSPLIDEVLYTFYENGAPEEILYDSKPHIGTDKLRAVVINIREKIKSIGGKVVFNARFLRYETTSDKIIAIYEHCGKEVRVLVDDIILAVGYSARDTLRSLHEQGVEFRQKAFSVGYRIEHLQEDINKAQYGEKMYANKLLPPADYKLFAHLPNGRTVYTFCMCPGGEVVPAMSENGQIVTNGMSYHARNGKNANSAILVSVNEQDYKSSHALAGMDFQEELEKRAFEIGKGKFICSKVCDFLKGNETTSLERVVPTIKPCYNLGRVDNLLPSELVESIKQGIVLLGKKLRGFDSPDAVLTGIETRSSAPFMIVRKESFETSVKNIYAVGEGAGMAGGIISSAVDGKKIALRIIDKYVEDKKWN